MVSLSDAVESKFFLARSVIAPPSCKSLKSDKGRIVMHVCGHAVQCLTRQRPGNADPDTFEVTIPPNASSIGADLEASYSARRVFGVRSKRRNSSADAGALVRTVHQGGLAESWGLQPGNLLVSVGGTSTSKLSFARTKYLLHEEIRRAKEVGQNLVLSFTRFLTPLAPNLDDTADRLLTSWDWRSIRQCCLNTNGAVMLQVDAGTGNEVFVFDVEAEGDHTAATAAASAGKLGRLARKASRPRSDSSASDEDMFGDLTQGGDDAATDLSSASIEVAMPALGPGAGAVAGAVAGTGTAASPAAMLVESVQTARFIALQTLEGKGAKSRASLAVHQQHESSMHDIRTSVALPPTAATEVRAAVATAASTTTEIDIATGFRELGSTATAADSVSATSVEHDMTSTGTCAGGDGGGHSNQYRADRTRAKKAGKLLGYGSSRRSTKKVGLDEIKIHAATWNVGNASPPEAGADSSLCDWIPHLGGDFDIIAVGAQESSYDSGVIGGVTRAVRSLKSKEAVPAKASSTIPSDAPASATAGQSTTVATPWSGMRERLASPSQKPPVSSELAAKNPFTSKNYYPDGERPNAVLLSPVTPSGASHSDSDSESSADDEMTCALPAKQRPVALDATARERTAAWDRILGAEYSKDHFFATIQEHLGPTFEPVCQIVEPSLREMRLIVLARTALRPFINHCETASENTGIGGVLGNKGGLLAALNVQGTSIGFVSCHLPPHADAKHLIARNAACAEILRGARVGNAGHSVYRKLQLDSHLQHVIWMGDMNYRIDLSLADQCVLGTEDVQHTEESATGHDTASLVENGVQKNDSLPVESLQLSNASSVASSVQAPDLSVDPDGPGACSGGEVDDKVGQKAAEKEKEKQKEKRHWQAVRKMITDRKWQALMEADQLNRELREGRLLYGFGETLPESLNFAPTFKVRRAEVGPEYNPKRTPSYCDRILFKSLPAHRSNLRLSEEGFVSAPNVTTSDHKPVSASFKLRTPPKMVLPNVTTAQSPCILFKNLSATNLKAADMGGTSDPYVKFYTDPPYLLGDITKMPRTTIKKANLNPIWNDAETPALHLCVQHREELKRCHLIMVVFDKDQALVDDLLGHTVIDFLPLLQDNVSLVSRHDFDVPLINDGTVHGRIGGTLELVWPEPESAMTAALGHHVASVRAARAKAQAQSERAEAGSGRNFGALLKGMSISGRLGRASTRNGRSDSCEASSEHDGAKRALSPPPRDSGVSSRVNARSMQRMPAVDSIDTRSSGMGGRGMSFRNLLSSGGRSAIADLQVDTLEMSAPRALTLLRTLQTAGLFKDRSHFLRRYPQVAVGGEIISHLEQHGWCVDRAHGRLIGEELIRMRMIAHAVRQTDPFKDKDKSFYRLTDKVEGRNGVMRRIQKGRRDRREQQQLKRAASAQAGAAQSMNRNDSL